jgi:hypothetical protein
MLMLKNVEADNYPQYLMACVSWMLIKKKKTELIVSYITSNQVLVDNHEI